MPTFTYDDHLEPVTVVIHGEEYNAIPAIPADEFTTFMGVYQKIPGLIERIRGDNSKDQIAAYQEFIALSIEGLDLVMTPESVERIKQRAKDRERPIPAETLASCFGDLVGYYMKSTRGDEDDPKATVAVAELSPSSAPTGGSSEANSSSAEPTSPGGPTTT